MAVTITAHAIVRYFERIEGLRFSEVRQKMRAAGEPESAIRGDTGVVKWMAYYMGKLAGDEAITQPEVEPNSDRAFVVSDMGPATPDALPGK